MRKALVSREDRGVCRAESAEDAKGRGSGRVARAGDDGAGDSVAPALLCVLSVLRAKYSAISAREPGYRVVKPVLGVEHAPDLFDEIPRPEGFCQQRTDFICGALQLADVA